MQPQVSFSILVQLHKGNTFKGFKNQWIVDPIEVAGKGKPAIFSTERKN